MLQFILDRHEPYAAVVLDRYSNCLMGNHSSGGRRSAGRSLIAREQVNFLRTTFHPLGVRRWIVNWDECRGTAGASASANWRDAGRCGGAALLDEIRGYLARRLRRVSKPARRCDLLVPIHVRKDDFELRFFCTIMTLGAPQGVTLQELRIETFFPADEASERTWRERFA